MPYQLCRPHLLIVEYIVLGVSIDLQIKADWHSPKGYYLADKGRPHNHVGSQSKRMQNNAWPVRVHLYSMYSTIVVIVSQLQYFRHTYLELLPHHCVTIIT